MTKDELVTGMVVRTKEKNKTNLYMVIFARYPVLVGDGFINLDSYNYDLCHKNDSEFDIVQVYTPTDRSSVSTFLRNIFTCKQHPMDYMYKKVWEREEVVEMTLDEVKEKLGIRNLKIVGD